MRLGNRIPSPKSQLPFVILEFWILDLFCRICSIGSIPIYDITTRTIYVFEQSGLAKDYQKNINELYEESELDVIAIDIEELPDDIFQRYIKLREYITLG